MSVNTVHHVWTEPRNRGSHSRTNPRISTRDTKTVNLFNDKLGVSDPTYPLILLIFIPIMLQTKSYDAARIGRPEDVAGCAESRVVGERDPTQPYAYAARACL